MGTASMTNIDEILSNEITIFKDRVRIDLQITTPGLQFDEAWERKDTMNYQGQSFHVVSLEDLKKSKRAAGRKVDLEDVRLLELPDEEDEGEEDLDTEQDKEERIDEGEELTVGKLDRENAQKLIDSIKSLLKQERYPTSAKFDFNLKRIINSFSNLNPK